MRSIGPVFGIFPFDGFAAAIRFQDIRFQKLEVSAMNMHRSAVLAVTAACIAGLAACKGAHTPTDAQLTQLLRLERAAPSDPRAPLDPQAVDCLRAWSGDVELSSNLPPSVSGDPAKNACKQRLDGWVADATRNPDKIKFEDASAPPAVRRAMALLADHRATAMMPNHVPTPGTQPPATMMPGNTPPAAAPGGPVDMTATVAAVDELDGLCQKAKQAAASGDTTQPISRYASFCDKRIEQMRTRISMLQQRGDSQQAQMMSQNVQRTLEAARQIATQKAAPTPKSQ
jgi:hypothetical protein